MSKKLNPKCPCPENCPRHGDCKACREYHASTKTLTYCQLDSNSNHYLEFLDSINKCKG